MSDAVDRGNALLARMKRTDQVSFYGAGVAIQELCDESERLEGQNKAMAGALKWLVDRVERGDADPTYHFRGFKRSITGYLYDQAKKALATDNADS